MKYFLVGIYDLKNNYFVNFDLTKDPKQFKAQMVAGITTCGRPEVKVMWKDYQVYLLQTIDSEDSNCEGEVLILNEEIVKACNNVEEN